MSLLASLKRKRRQVELDLDLKGRRISSIRAFDEHVTAPLHGFSGAAASYYARASSRPYLPQIQTPTLILQAKDDPFLTEEVLPQRLGARPGRDPGDL